MDTATEQAIQRLTFHALPDCGTLDCWLVWRDQIRARGIDVSWLDSETLDEYRQGHGKETRRFKCKRCGTQLSYDGVRPLKGRARINGDGTWCCKPCQRKRQNQKGATK